jgi:hypothetical protein
MSRKQNLNQYERIVDELDSYYTDKNLKGFAKQVWVLYLSSHLSPEQAKACLIQCIISQKFLPTPQEFIKLEVDVAEEASNRFAEIFNYYGQMAQNIPVELPEYLLTTRDILRYKLGISPFDMARMDYEVLERSRQAFIQCYKEQSLETVENLPKEE